MSPADTKGTATDRSDFIGPLHLWLVQLALAVEATSVHLIGPILIIGFYLALALLGVIDQLPNWAVIGLLGICLGGMIWLARHLPKTLVWPNAGLAIARIETDAGLRHRPLSAMADQLGAGDSQLWAAYRQRLAASIPRLSLAPPRPVIADADPMALRALLILAMVIGAIIAGGDGPGRLSRALAPNLFATPVPPQFEAWITPPKATLRPPVFLTKLKPGDRMLVVPQGSMLTVKVIGARRIIVDTADGKQSRNGGRTDNLEVQTALVHDGRIQVIADGTNLINQTVQVIPSLAPKLVWTDPPTPARRGSLRLGYRAYDHYGIAAIKMMVLRPKPRNEPDNGAGSIGSLRDVSNFDVDLPPPTRTADPDQFGKPDDRVFSGFDQVVFRDLTSHPWAGLDVVLQLEATNLEGKTGQSPPQVITLPEREFHHPVARQIIAERKTLARDANLMPRVARALSALLEKPEAFGDDLTAYLALRASTRRLADAEGIMPEGIFELLWATALRIEDGRLSDAAKNLREAQEKLESALATGKPQSEIDRLMSDVRQAMEDYLRQLSTQAGRQGALNKGPPPPGTKIITERDLAAMMDKAQQLARAGNREAARELLAMIQSLFENMGDAGQAADDPGDQATGEALSKLGELMGKQQRLMDQTLREGQKGPRGKTPGGEPQAGMDPNIAAEQKALRKELNRIIEGLSESGDLPQALGAADEAMRQAEGALGAKRPMDATNAQSEALTNLRESAKALGKQMMENMAKRGDGRGGKQPGGADDPLGRPEATKNAGDGAGVNVPDEPDMARAREIMDELRRRSGERLRPKPELDYLDRLLEQF